MGMCQLTPCFGVVWIVSVHRFKIGVMLQLLLADYIACWHAWCACGGQVLGYMMHTRDPSQTGEVKDIGVRVCVRVRVHVRVHVRVCVCVCVEWTGFQISRV